MTLGTVGGFVNELNQQQQAAQQPQPQQAAAPSNYLPSDANYLQNYVFNNVPRMIQQLVQSGEINSFEANWMINNFNTCPTNMPTFLQKAVAPYAGMTGVNYQTVINNALNILRGAVVQFRRNNQNNMNNLQMNNGYMQPAFQGGFNQMQMPMQQMPVYQNGFAQQMPVGSAFGQPLLGGMQQQMQMQQLPMQQQMPMQQMNGYGYNNFNQPYQSAERNSMNRIYGIQAQNPTLTACNSDRSIPQQSTPMISSMTQAIPQRTNLQRQPTGRTEDIPLNLNDARPDIIPPKWEKVEPKDEDKEMEKKLDAEVAYLTSYLITYGKSTVSQKNYSLRYPIQNISGAITDIISDDPDAAKSPTFAHKVSADELLFLNSENYQHGKSVIDNCVKILKEREGINGIREVISVLNRYGDNFDPLRNNILAAFNRAASVNFVKKTEDGRVLCLNAFESLNKLDNFLVDSGDKDFAVWKEDKVAFGRALTTCLKASFGRFFREDRNHYIDLTDLKEVATIAADESAMIRYSDGTSGRLTFVGEDAAVKKRTIELKEILNKKLFVIKFEKEFVFHNLDLADVDYNDYSLNVVEPSPEQQIVEELFNKYGSILLVDITDHTQYTNALIVGRTFDNEIVVRRLATDR